MSGRLHFLNRKVRINISNNEFVGEVFCFTENALILKYPNSQFEVFNVSEFENVQLEVLEEG